eukprot:TRINITY_DN68760_c0_g1_i1.p1 TRINITY_DN68760_c0_g1~~TRINITY_DN68760_c0_g1_i1.p1  ORF type:complete len:443 (+),score=71.59 TRINITY_DN68760_c0_g1_i1:155-1330(+)
MEDAEPFAKRIKLGDCEVQGKAPGADQLNEEEPLAYFSVMSDEDAARHLLPYSQEDSFGSKLREQLDSHGFAIVSGVLTDEDRLEFSRLKRLEECRESTQVGHMTQAQGEVAWKARLHPRVRELFAHIYGTADLSTSVDLPSMFYTPEGTPGETENDQWLHVDQNFHTGVTHKCYQGVLYIRSSDANSSTTALWPGSHLPAVYGCILADPLAIERGAKEDEAGVRFGHFLSINGLKNDKTKTELLEAALAGTKRLPVPAGSLLLWDSRTIHQGWRGGPRFAVPVCWEPRDRVPEAATLRKLFMAAVGVASSHSPSEGRVHPHAATRRGAGAMLRKPTVRPYAARPAEELSAEVWQEVWADWPEEAWAEQLVGTKSKAALTQILRPEVSSAL